MLIVNVNGGNVSDNEQRKIPHTRDGHVGCTSLRKLK